MVDGAAEGGKEGLTRRKFTLGVLVASIAGAFGSLFALVKVLSPPKKMTGYTTSIQPGDRLVYAEGSKTGAPIDPSALKIGDAVLAYPAGKTSNPANLVQLVKFAVSDFKPPTRVDFTDQGLAAYSAICTHLGCTVSWVKNQQAPAASFTECFCHNSFFDPKQGARVLGGPAPIPLAQIGIKVTKEGIIFTSVFTGPIGPQV